MYDIKPEVFLNILAALLAFIVVPLFMFGNQPEIYEFIKYPLFFKSAILFAIIFTLLLSFANLVLHRFKLCKLSQYFSFFIVLWVLVAGLFFPVSSSTGMIEAQLSPVNKPNFWITFVVVGSLSFVGLTRFKKNIVMFILVVLIVTLVPALIAISHSKQSVENEQPFVLSEKKNIFVLGFDGVPGKIVSELLNEDITYSRDFKDFVVFRNAISQSPATRASLTGELFGTQDYKSLGDTEDALISALKAEGLSEKMLLNQVADSYQHLYNWGKNIKWPEDATHFQSSVDTFNFFKYSIARIWTRHILNLLNWGDNGKIILPYIIGSYTESGLSWRILMGASPEWDQTLNSTTFLYDELMERMSVGASELSVRYLHFTFTHYPVDFDESCNFRGDNKQWHASHQNYEGVVLEGRCALHRFSLFIDKLKDLGIYDNTLIVLKSDHGKPAEYFSEYPDNLMINGHPMWGYNRYRPTLMIKNFGADKPEITYKDELVLINDLAKTLCVKSEIDVDCKVFPGIDLLGESLELDMPYYLYVVKDSKSDFRFDSHISILIPSRKLSLVEALENSALVELSPLLN